MKTRNVAIGSLAVAITLLMLPAGALGDGDNKASVPYTNGFLGDVTWADPQCDPDLAQNCVAIPADMTKVTITVVDDNNDPVSAFVQGYGSVCGETTIEGEDFEELPNPIHLTANGAVFGVVECGPGNLPATSGTFELDFE